MEIKDRIIVALDVDNLAAAKTLVQDLAPYVGCFKVGLELLTAVGAPQVVEFIHGLGGKIFFDGKFNDIPNTVGQAAKAVANLGVKIFNLHAASGLEAMKQAVANKKNSLVLAVTVLTSLNDENSKKIFGAVSQEKVLDFALQAKNAGCDGIVCSPQELKLFYQKEEFKDFLRVTPGVRPKWADTCDQQRIMTPQEAIKLGASFLVIGRPITKPPKEIGTPIEAAKRIIEEIRRGNS